MGLKILHNGQIADFSDSKYDPNGYGSMRLNIRTGAGDTGIKKYGLATSASHTSDKRVRMNVSGSTYYIGTSSALSRQSEYTTYSTYYSYTYTNSEQHSSIMTRTGTLTTATRTQPALYTYQASYYTGVSSGYTVQTSSHYSTRSAQLSSTRASTYTAYYNITRSSAKPLDHAFLRVSVTRQATNTRYSFANGSTRYTSTRAYEAAGSSTTFTSSTFTTVPHSEIRTATNTGTYNAKTNTAGATRLATYNVTSEYYYTVLFTGAAVTATRASAIYVAPPNNYAVQAWQGPYGRAGGNIAVASGSYKASSSETAITGGHAANVSFGSSISQYYTNLVGSSTQRVGAATLTSTNTPIGGVPANYTLSAGPAQIASQASYTYTDAGCTQSYESSYSTSYWTVTNTLTSNLPTQSSVGSTATTRASYYTEHNFV